ncbi:hypothetical protein [Bacteroides sp. UBA939]|uniref:hypothetical protein n=1 Tax=Bacteroides sp. UBA939 TaxID=1946092 RepID=UPI0025C72A47|nr:hypothetical protein [Bacteroides sp. UBA939]
MIQQNKICPAEGVVRNPLVRLVAPVLVCLSAMVTCYEAGLPATISNRLLLKRN